MKTKYLTYPFIFVLFFSLNTDAQKNIDYKYFRSAMVQKSKGNHEQAIKDFGYFLKLHPKAHPPAYYYRGHTYMNMGNYQAAADDFVELTILEPESIDGPFSAGRAFYRLNNFEEAIKYFTQALDIDAFHAPSLNDRGMSYMYISKYVYALLDFRKAITANPSFTMAYNNAGAARYFNQDIDKPVKKDIEEARDYFTQAIELDSSLSLAYRNRAAMNLFLKDYEKALIDLEAAENINPKEVMVYFYRGVIHSDQENYSQAITAFDKAITLEQDMPYVYEEIGNLYKKQGNFEQAIQNYQKAQIIDPSINKLYIGLMDYRTAIIYALQKNEKQMHRYLNKAKKYKIFSDKRVYQDLLTAKELGKYRYSKKLKKFVRSVTKTKKNNKFNTLELRWFRMRA